jgi:hypothetical protein
LQTRSLFAEEKSFQTPFHHLVGKVDLLEAGLLSDTSLDPSQSDICDYSLGRRRQQQTTRSEAGTNPLQALADHPQLKALVTDHCQQALGCDVKAENLCFHARRCEDEGDYFLSPHADCPKTICALLIYLWAGQRGTSLYRLSGHRDSPPETEDGLRERVNNFTHREEYQRGNLDVITQIKPDCYACFEHVKTIRPDVGVFLLIPNTRFQGARLDLPRSYHGVGGPTGTDEASERRELILIDVKLPPPPPPTLRSLLRARLSRLRR